MSDATELLGELNNGNRQVSEDLLPLVHEVYLRLANRQWNTTSGT